MWIEERTGPRGTRYLCRERRDGKTVTRYSTPDERDARHFARMGTRVGMSTGDLMNRLKESFGDREQGPGPKFSTYAFEVIDNDPNIGDTSRTPYRNTITNHIVGSRIDVFISKIDPPLLRAFWTNLTPKKSYEANGSGMKASVYRLLNKVFNVAVQDGVLEANPLLRTGIKRPSKKRAREVEPLTIDEVEELADAAPGDRERLMILLGGYCGLRGGEVGGLRAKDIDAKACSLNIRQAVKGQGKAKHLGLPKGDKARRITVPCSLSRELRKFAMKHALKDGRIFYIEGGGFLGSKETNEVSQNASAKIEFRPVWYHLLRHTAASLLVAEGASIKDVQAFLGIATAAILLDTYAHAFAGTDQRLADSLERRRGDYRDRLKQARA